MKRHYAMPEHYVFHVLLMNSSVIYSNTFIHLLSRFVGLVFIAEWELCAIDSWGAINKAVTFLHCRNKKKPALKPTH